MDYDQSTQNKEVDLFTTGAGTNEEDVNTVESENNLDLSNNSTEWTNLHGKEDYQHIGNVSITSTGHLENTTNLSQNSFDAVPGSVSQQNSPNALGQIVPTLPPGYIEESSTESNRQLREKEDAREKHLDNPVTAQKIVEEQEAKLSQDSNIFAFSEAISKMRLEANSGEEKNA